MAITAGELVEVLVSDELGGGSDTPVMIEDSNGNVFEVRSLAYDLTRNVYVLGIN